MDGINIVNLFKVDEQKAKDLAEIIGDGYVVVGNNIYHSNQYGGKRKRRKAKKSRRKSRKGRKSRRKVAKKSRKTRRRRRRR